MKQSSALRFSDGGGGGIRSKRIVSALVDSAVIWSPCKLYRYALRRTWDTGLPVCNFLMLNPSTADEYANDPTVARCQNRAKEWGFGTLLVTNLFAYRSTDPQKLREVADPVGRDNDQHIRMAATLSDLVVCAWGQHGRLLGRAERVRFSLLADVPLHYLRMTRGKPHHPLYLPYDLKPQPWPSVSVQDGTVLTEASL